MSNQSYLKCEHTPLDEEDFDLHPNWKSGHVYNEEDEDGDIVEDEEDDCDIEDDDYCSDESSTTSTSSTNNQPDNTRVCDCCYCEVFGNGAAPVAPTSRNYNEMRERLRLRLSKRRAEKCERSIQQNGNISKDDSANDRGGGTQTGTNGTNTGNKSNTPVVDQRNLDELLNYINGKGHQEKSSSKKKDKNKNNNNNNKKSNNKNNSHTKSMHKEDKDFEKCNNQNHGSTNHNNNNNQHHHNHHYQPNSTGGDPTTSGNKKQQASNSAIHQNHHSSHSCSSHQQNQLDNHQNNHRSSTISSNRATPEVNSKQNINLDQQQQHDENYQPPQNSPTSNGKQKRKDREKSTNAKDQMSNKTQQNLSVKTISSSNGGSSHETCESNLETNHTTSTNANKQANTSNNQNSSINAATNTESINLSCHQNKATKKEPDDNNLSAPEDVFMPRDIDLNDGQLDEMERELEAFKRFCFDSVPLVKKERVRVQLKDSDFFQELNERITNGSTISNQQHAGTSRSLQAQMFRRKVSRI